MTHDEIEQYLKDKDLNTFEYQLAIDAMLFAEQKTIERACDWLKKHHNYFPHTEWGANREAEELKKELEL